MKTRSIIILLSLMNLVNYVDRFSLAASLSHIKSDLLLSDFESGTLMSAFILTYIAAAIVFGLMANKHNRLNILKFGGFLWGLATISCGLIVSYNQLLVARSFLGIGEAAFAAVAPAFLNDLATNEDRGKKMAIFSAGLPLGLALGYMGGGWLTEVLGWRISFVSVGIPALILTAVVFLIKDTAAKTVALDDLPAYEKIKRLATNTRYMYALLGYTAYTFVAGGVAYWMPLYTEKTFSVSTAQANTIFGGAAIGFGLVGNFVGGAVGDWWEKKSKHGHLKLCAASMLFAVLPYVMTFGAQNLMSYIIWIGICQFFFFLSTGPINVVILEEGGPSVASFAMSTSIFVTHLLGDALSPPFIGWVSDKTGELRYGMLSCLPAMFLAAGLWLVPLFKKRNTNLLRN